MLIDYYNSEPMNLCMNIGWGTCILVHENEWDIDLRKIYFFSILDAYLVHIENEAFC